LTAIDPGAPALTGGVDLIAPHVWRIVAPNPSALTGPGTNTYVIGSDARLVIDPGPSDPAHLETIVALGAGRIEQILCTHSHSDHSPGAAPLKALTGGATVRGLPAPYDAYQDRTYAPDQGFDGGERIAVAGATLRALHTPGHASNHVCFLLEETGMLFTGDHLMSGSTVVILPPDGSMRLYVESLRDLLTQPIASLAPGHGAVIADAPSDIERVIAHRLRREAKLVKALSRLGEATLDDVLAEVYDDTPRTLHGLAKFSLLAHAIKLEEEGRASRRGETWTWLGE
jgi:glyoxylase-like metal-dependent hydrolase (beta-lactamase superfamily II)